ncbi:MAG TPA: amidohydrolase family protein [Chloroflexota bacterium]|nr:amidohydrolase family protein [Chloroflexota bacterium]
MSIVIDTDAHFFPVDAFDDETSRRRFRSRWPRVQFDALGRDFIVFPEQFDKLSPYQRSIPCSLIPGRHHPGYYDPAPREQWLDEAGIDMQVLVPSPATFTYHCEPELGAAVCRSYNDAIARVLKAHPGRFIGLAVLPMQDPVAAVEELDRATLELGIHAPLVISNVNDKNLNEYEFWPVYERMELLGVPLIVHGNRNGPTVGLDRLPHMHMDNALGFLFEGSLAIASLIMYGVLDMYPKLRVGVLETGAGYLTYLMDRLEEIYEMETFGGISPYQGKRVKDLILKRPREYMDQFWVCFNVGAEARNVPHVVRQFGADRFMVNSDFPHGVGGAGEGMVDIVNGIDEISRSEKDTLLGLAACELFAIDPETRQQRRPAAV